MINLDFYREMIESYHLLKGFETADAEGTLNLILNNIQRDCESAYQKGRIEGLDKASELHAEAWDKARDNTKN